MLLAPILTAATEDHHIMPSVPFCFWGEGRNNDPGWQARLDSSSSFGDTRPRVASGSMCGKMGELHLGLGTRMSFYDSI